eukprot:1182120-Prorocentrum_minimum.AAC.1
MPLAADQASHRHMWQARSGKVSATSSSPSSSPSALALALVGAWRYLQRMFSALTSCTSEPIGFTQSTKHSTCQGGSGAARVKGSGGVG